ncbi:hypothetical protein QR680_019009 [Steinernema hermaphroditum]|uniref:C3H1-type domain-containing protein n=1 Tax=Steinernema hermaphroditum TaxID=289476 RepID=A0AA39LR78_9BILA|nr:hypothetical protein QR680_019009 [Steinernema hermaphroditum]
MKKRKRSPLSEESQTAAVVNAPPAKITKSIPKEEEDFWFDSGVGEDSPVKKPVKVITKKPGQGTLMKKSLKMILAMDTAGLQPSMPFEGSDNNMFKGLNPKDRRNLLMHFNKLMENRRPMTQEEINEGRRNYPSPALKPRNPELYKTTYCQYWKATNQECRYGAQCWYAHGPHELRQRVGVQGRSMGSSSSGRSSEDMAFGQREIDALFDAPNSVFNFSPSPTFQSHHSMFFHHDVSPTVPFQEHPQHFTLGSIGSERRKRNQLSSNRVSEKRS